MTFGLWARRASRLLHPAILCCIWYVFLFKNIPEKENGWRWIRTTEANCSRFTVCPLWPLGNLPIYHIHIQLIRFTLQLTWIVKADDRTRTDNLLITNQLLCQLSHIGVFCFSWFVISRSAYAWLASLLNRHELSHIGVTFKTVFTRNGAYRARTYDPLLVRQMLSQLS